MDINGDGILDGNEISHGLKQSGVFLSPEEDIAIRKWVGNGKQTMATTSGGVFCMYLYHEI